MRSKSPVLVLGLTALVGAGGCGPRKDPVADAGPDFAIGDSSGETVAKVILTSLVGPKPGTAADERRDVN